MSDLDEAISRLRHRVENAPDQNSSLPPNPWSLAEVLVMLYDRLQAAREDHAQLWEDIHGSNNKA